MIFGIKCRSLIPIWATPLAVALVLALSGVASAQVKGGGGDGRGGHGGHGPRDNGGGDKPADTSPTGSVAGYILKYQPPKQGADEDEIATLTIKPKEGRPVKLLVLRDEAVSIELGSRKDFEPDEYADVLAKGLYCNCSWKETERKKNPDDKKPKKVKTLVRVSFDSIEVLGKIEEISDDLVVIRGKPSGDRPWPDAPMKKNNPKNNGKEKAAKVFSKKLKLRIFEEVTKFKDVDNQTMDISEFEAKQEVTATLVYSRKGGIVLDLKSPKKREGGEEPPKKFKRGARPGM